MLGAIIGDIVGSAYEHANPLAQVSLESSQMVVDYFALYG
jgi:ADP-ribosylglycohydrolase